MLLLPLMPNRAEVCADDGVVIMRYNGMILSKQASAKNRKCLLRGNIRDLAICALAHTAFFLKKPSECLVLIWQNLVEGKIHRDIEYIENRYSSDLST